MLWDGLILVMAVVLAVNGWNRGLLASWRGPLAIVAATLIVQPFYVDFATWITSRLRIGPEAAVIMGYLMLWFSIEAVLEILLNMTLRAGVQERPVFFDRLGGALYGLVKACVIVVLPLMAVAVPLKIPEPPADRSGLVLPIRAGDEGSYLVPGFRAVAEALVPFVGGFVVSEKEPSFQPTYDGPRKQQAEPGGDEGEEVDAADRKEIEDLLR